MEKTWSFSEIDETELNAFAREFKISKVVAGILLHRGMKDKDEIRRFLDVNEQPFYDPFLLKDMDKAVNRIKQAINQNENIVVYGDYDVDGITATVVLLRTLRQLGAKVDFYIPDRQEEGYGFNAAALKSLSAVNQVLISVDCGITAIEEVDQVADLFDVIITDHHLPGEQLPKATAVINPQRLDCSYPDKKLAGVGVAFKLCQALWKTMENKVFLEDLDIVALGTIADIVPLLGENRRMVKCGLEQMSDTDKIGLQALLAVCDLNGKKIDAGHVGFILGPRLNAAGRLMSARVGVELLLSDDKVLAMDLAQKLNEENSERQLIEKQILAKAENQLAEVDVAAQKVLVLAGEDWHTGVIGIVASRLVEKYYKPVVIIGIKDGIGKGSCRSIRGFHMQEALQKCQDLLLGFGGHAQAAGLSILPKEIDALRERLTQAAIEVLSEKDYIPVLNIEARVSMTQVDDDLVNELTTLEPYGMGNPRPVFSCEHVQVVSARQIGKEGTHLRLNLGQDGKEAIALAWNKGDLAGKVARVMVDVAFQPEFNVWQGRQSIQFKLQDLKIEAEKISLNRELVGKVYLLLKHAGETDGRLDMTLSQLATAYQNRYQKEISTFFIENILKILAELNLVRIEKELLQAHIYLQAAPKEKLDLMQSPTFARGLMDS
jgi:single-stranded-DNA-specific exonuclease